ncbi:MAG: autotransporter domain-containing protein [Chlorobiaceae bacterium]|nr:autotransporter domain-containing protein [Chlorobiaceae bacterium]
MMNKHPFHSRWMVAAFVLAIITDQAQGQDATWISTGGAGDWATTARWSGLAGTDPYPDNHPGRLYDVILPSSSLVGAGTSAGSGITLESLRMESSGATHARLDIYEGMLFNAGDLKNYSGKTLSGGDYVLFGGTLQFNNADIQTLDANTLIYLAGASARIQNSSGQNALSGFSENRGYFGIGSYGGTGVDITVAPVFTNYEQVVVSDNSTLNATSMTNYRGLFLNGPGATLNVNELNNLTLPGQELGTIRVSGANAVLNVDKLVNLNGAVLVEGSGAILNANETTNTDVSIFSGLHVDGFNAVFNAGELTNFSGTVLRDGNYQVNRGTFKFNNADIHTLAEGTTLYLRSADARVQDQFGTDGLRNFSDNRGIFELQNDATFTAALPFSNSGLMGVSYTSAFNAPFGFINTGLLSVEDSANVIASTMTNAGRLNIWGGIVNAGTLTNFSGTTLTGGYIEVRDGTLIFNNADIQTLGNGTSLLVSSANGRIFDQFGQNALARLSDNQGTLIIGYDSGTPFIFTTAPTFTNSGAIQANKTGTIDASSLTNFSKDTGTLTGGHYSANGGTLIFRDASIRTLASGTSLDLNGPTARVQDQFGNDALNGIFADNRGEFTIWDLSGSGATFTAAPTFTNTGVLHVWEQGEFNANTLTNFSNATGTLTGGVYDLQNGILKFNDAAIVTLAANTSLFLDGSGAHVQNQNGQDALNGYFAHNLGVFSIGDVFGSGFTFNTASTFTNSGTLYIQRKVIFNAHQLTNFSVADKTLSGGSYLLWGGTLQFNGADIRNIGANTSLTLRSGAKVLDGGAHDALAGLIMNQGEFSLGEAMNFNLNPGFDNSGTINVGQVDDFPFMGSFSGPYPIYSDAILNITGNVTNSGLIRASCPLPVSASSETVYGKGVVNLNRATLDQTGGGTLEAGERSVVNLNASIVRGGFVTTNGSGVVNIADGRSQFDGVSTSGSMIVAGSGELEFTGTHGVLGGTIDNEGGVIFNHSGVETFSGVISGPGNVTKSGPGTLIVSENNTYTGGTSVEAGKLVVNGRLSNSPVSVAGGATLGGNGAVRSLDLLSGAFIAPGNSIGTFSITGSSPYHHGGTYQLEYRAPIDLGNIVAGSLRGRNVLETPGLMTGDQDADLIHVTGGAVLSGGGVVLSNLGGDYAGALSASPDGKIRYLVLRADGGLGGTKFSALSNGNGNVTLNYPNSSDVELVVSGDPYAPVLITGHAPKTLGFVLPIWSRVPQYGAHGTILDIDGSVSDKHDGKSMLWVRPYLVSGLMKERETVASARYSSSGISIGGEYKVGGNFYLGGGLTYGSTEAKFQSEPGRQVSRDYQGAAYAIIESGAWRGGMDAGFSHYDVDNYRNAMLGGIAGASFGMDKFRIGGVLQYTLKVSDCLDVLPKGRLLWERLHRDSFREIGAGAENFHASSSSSDLLRGELWANLRYVDKCRPSLTFETGMGWQHLSGASGLCLSGIYEGDTTGSVYRTESDPYLKDSLMVRAQLGYAVNDNLSIHGGFAGIYNNLQEESMFNLRLELVF